MNNHILDIARYLWWPNVLPGSESVSVLSKDLLNLEPLYVTLATHFTVFYYVIPILGLVTHARHSEPVLACMIRHNPQN